MKTYCVGHLIDTVGNYTERRRWESEPDCCLLPGGGKMKVIQEGSEAHSRVGCSGGEVSPSVLVWGF